MEWVDNIGVWFATGLTYVLMVGGALFLIVCSFWLLWAFTPRFHKEMILRRLDAKLEELKEEREEKEKALD